jgi:integrase
VSAFLRGSGYVAKFQYRGRQVWVPGGPWSTRREALQAEQRHREKIARRRTEETCASFADRWLEEWPRKAAGTRRTYAAAAKRFAEHFGATLLADVERLSARTWALTVPRNVSTPVSTMFEDARNVGLVEANPFSNLRLPRTEATEEVHPPSVEEFRELLAACTAVGGYGSEFRALLQFTAWTGVRAGELMALRWKDVGEDTLWIRRAVKADGAIGKPKNGREREIPLLEPARVLDQVPRRHGSELIFHSMRGRPLTKGSLHYAWREVRAASGVPRERAIAELPTVRFHDLRHFCATQLLERGLRHFDVAVQLGHEDGGLLVMQRYGHPSKDAARERLLASFRSAELETGSQTGSARS